MGSGVPPALFCAGHTYLPDGRLLVAGGHLTDGDGIDHACTYAVIADARLQRRQ